MEDLFTIYYRKKYNFQNTTVGSTIKGRGRCRGGLGCTEYMVTRRGSRQPAFRVNSLRIPCILSPPHIVMFASTTSACLLAPVALHALFARRRLSGQAGGQRLSSPRPSSSPWVRLSGQAGELTSSSPCRACRFRPGNRFGPC